MPYSNIHHIIDYTDCPTSLQAYAAITRRGCLSNPCQFIIQESS